MATNTIQPWFRCFTRHRHPKDEWSFCSYGSYIFQPCMHTGWLLETSPSDHYWWRYEVGQWLVFWWFWGWGTSDMRLTRRKLGKKHTPQSWRLPLPYGCHGALPSALPHTTISQHAAWQVYVVKTREYYCFYYLFAILRHDALSTCRACVFSGCRWWKPVRLIGLINRVGWLKPIWPFRCMGFHEVNL